MSETIRITDNAREYPASIAQQHMCIDAVERRRERQTNECRQISNPVPSVKRVLKTGLDGEV